MDLLLIEGNLIDVSRQLYNISNPATSPHHSLNST